MSNRLITAGRAAVMCCFVMLVVTASILASGSASAQGHDGGRGRGHGQYREQSHDNGLHRGAGQRGRGHDWEREHWRNGYRGYGREPARGPDIYYSAPPVVHLPPAYYQPPSGLSLNFGFPLYH